MTVLVSFADKIPDLIEKIPRDRIADAAVLMVVLSPDHLITRRRILVGVAVFAGLMLTTSLYAMLIMNTPIPRCLAGLVFGGGFLAATLAMVDGQRFSSDAFKELAGALGTVTK